MDCRKALWGFVAAVLTASAGCQTVPIPPDAQNAAKPLNPPAAAASPAPVVPPPGVPIAKESDKPKKTPKASTCVAVGQFLEGEVRLSTKATPLEKQRELDKARRSYQEALRLDPKHAPAYSALGHLYVDLGDYERALATYQKGLQKCPKEPSLWFDLGMFHARKKEWDPALSCMSKAVDLEPENRHYSNTLGFCLARAGRIQESLSLFSKSSGQAVAYYNVGRVLRDNNQEDLSRRYLQHALALNPNYPEAQQMLASLGGANNGLISVGFQSQ
jgi:Tfp pilus assembly protein PilF